MLLTPESYEKAKVVLDPEGLHNNSENRVDLHYVGTKRNTRLDIWAHCGTATDWLQ